MTDPQNEAGWLKKIADNTAGGGGGSGGVAQGTATVAAPTYVEGSNNALSQDLTGALRVTGTLTAGGLAQGSDTAGQQGGISMGAATTAAPTYTTAKTYPLSLTTVGALRVDGSAATQPVSGTITANAGSGTFAISAASLPLPTGAATSANQTTMNTTLGSPFQAGGSIGNTSFASTQSGTWNITNVSGTVSLPTGASTAAKQPALGTAGSASTDVLTIQGIASGTPIIVGGNVASGATDSGNPVKVGAVYNSTFPTYTTGQRADLQSDLRGNLRITAIGGASSGSDGLSNSTLTFPFNVSNVISLPVSGGYLFNGSTWDRARGDVNGQVSQPYALASSRWGYAAASGGISNTTTAVTIIAAGGAGVRNYVTSIQVDAGTLGAATEIAVRDGAGGTVLWRGFITTGGVMRQVNFPVPLKGTANTLMEVVTLTASVTGSVYFNAQGYQGS